MTGLQIPFVKRAPMVTFRKPIGSVSVSGHKFIGAPVPCGVVITRQKYIAALANNVEYLNSRDATIMGSRNGYTFKHSAFRCAHMQCFRLPVVVQWQNMCADRRVKGVCWSAGMPHCTCGTR